jgi:hypothetical protein
MAPLTMQGVGFANEIDRTDAARKRCADLSNSARSAEPIAVALAEHGDGPYPAETSSSRRVRVRADAARIALGHHSTSSRLVRRSSDPHASRDTSQCYLLGIVRA